MKQYKGAVLFVDILGIGPLTRGDVPITDIDYKAWNLQGEHRSIHSLCAKLLMKFRSELNDIRLKYKSVNVAQLSDCAFIWSKNSSKLLDAARETMWSAARAGVLCRGGMAFGEIVEPDKVNRIIGKFVLGEAVTKAVDIEHAGKGCRIFCDVSMPQEVSNKVALLDEPFVGLKNPTDCSVTDEFRWYRYPDMLHKYSSIERNEKERILGLMELVSILRYSPKMRWNTASTHGQIHVASSIEAISSCVEDFTNGLDYRMRSEVLIGHFDYVRSDEIMRRYYQRIASEVTETLDEKITR